MNKSMLFTVAFLALSIFQSTNGPAAPQLDLPPSQDVLADVLLVPSARVDELPRAEMCKDAGRVYQIRPGITPPRVIYPASPAYSPQARSAKKEGTVVIAAVVSRDGVICKAHVQQRLGMGLDEKALEALNQWVFEPARKDGQKVSVEIMIEVNFKLYNNRK